MRPARILLLLVAIIAGGLAAFLATRGSGPAPIVQEIVAPKQEAAGTEVLVAKGPIGVGQRLRTSDVEWQAWPDGAVRPEYITIAKTPDAPTKITGAVARFEIFQGEPILDQKLVHSDQGFLSAVLDPGMRGVSVPVTASSGSGGFIIPNDRVDVVVTDALGGQTTSRVVLSDVKVLAIGTRLGQSGTTGTPAGDPADPKSQIFTSDSIATLELLPSQADTLINATATGKISLVLRSVADFGKTAPAAADTNDDSQTVKVIRFGREASITAGSADQGQATVAPAAYVAPATPIAAQPIVTVTTPGTTTTNPDGSVTVTAPATTTTTTSTPADDTSAPAPPPPSVK